MTENETVKSEKDKAVVLRRKHDRNLRMLMQAGALVLGVLLMVAVFLAAAVVSLKNEIDEIRQDVDESAKRQMVGRLERLSFERKQIVLNCNLIHSAKRDDPICDEIPIYDRKISELIATLGQDAPQLGN